MLIAVTVLSALLTVACGLIFYQFAVLKRSMKKLVFGMFRICEGQGVELGELKSDVMSYAAREFKIYDELETLRVHRGQLGGMVGECWEWLQDNYSSMPPVCVDHIREFLKEADLILKQPL